MSTPTTLSLPVLKELIPDGVEYGSNLLVEFEPRSVWFEASLTLTAHALNNGVRTEYHTFQRPPKEISRALTKLGVDVDALQRKSVFAVIDSHTVQTGLGGPETQERAISQSVKLADWSISFVKYLKAGAADEDRNWLHIDDNTTILLDYNQERDFIDLWRTRVIPYIRDCGSVLIYSLIAGVASDAFYKKLESLSDIILDFKSEEREGRLEQLARVSATRGRTVDTRWRRLKCQDNGEVAITE